MLPAAQARFENAAPARRPFDHGALFATGIFVMALTAIGLDSTTTRSRRCANAIRSSCTCAYPSRADGDDRAAGARARDGRGQSLTAAELACNVTDYPLPFFSDLTIPMHDASPRCSDEGKTPMASSNPITGYLLHASNPLPANVSLFYGRLRPEQPDLLGTHAFLIGGMLALVHGAWLIRRAKRNSIAIGIDLFFAIDAVLALMSPAGSRLWGDCGARNSGWPRRPSACWWSASCVPRGRTAVSSTTRSSTVRVHVGCRSCCSPSRPSRSRCRSRCGTARCRAASGRSISRTRSGSLPPPSGTPSTRRA